MSSFRLISLYSWSIIFICFVVILGWQFDIPILRSIIPDAPQTTPLTALLMLVLGIALAISGKVANKPVSSPWVWIYKSLSAIAVLAALWTGIQYLFHLSPSIEIIFYPELVREQSEALPGRPSPLTVLSAIFIGSSVFLAFSPKQSTQRIALVLSMIGLVFPWVALFGYTTMTSEFYLIPSFPRTGMSPISAIAFIVLGLGVMNLWPDKGFMGLLRASSSGGTVVKILLPIVMLVPLLLSWIINYAKSIAYFDLSFDLALNWGLTTLLMAGTIIWSGVLIHKRDLEKEKLLSDLKKKEEENAQYLKNLELAQHVARMGYYETDFQLGVCNASDNFCHLFGLKNNKFPVEEFQQLVHPDDFDYVMKAYAECIAEHKNFQAEYRLINPQTNETLFIKSNSYFTYKENNEVEKVVGIKQDITQQKKIEAEIFELNHTLEQKVNERTIELEKARNNLEKMVEQRTEQLRLSNQELEAFSYSVSHDLRAPLRAITGYSNILLEDYEQKLDEEGQKVIATIIRNITRMGQLIDDILAFSRLSRAELSHYSLDMQVMFQEAYRNLRSLESESREIEFCVNDLPPAKGDRVMIMQVITNLVSNALKYTRSKKKAGIYVGHKVEENKNVYYIKDNGVGFDERHKKKLFEVFQRLHKESEFEGTGVGLAIVQRVIHKHGGKVWSESVLGEGSTFYFTLS